MKTLLIGRHSLKDKQAEYKDQISEAGALRMYRQGRRFIGRRIHKVFRTSLIRTTQSINLFLAGAAQFEVPEYEVVTGFGNDEEFVPICPPEVMALYNAGMPHFEAMERVFGDEGMSALCVGARKNTRELFAKIGDEQIGFLSAHDPFVSLAVIGRTEETLKICRNLPEACIFELVQDISGEIALSEIYPPED